MSHKYIHYYTFLAYITNNFISKHNINIEALSDSSIMAAWLHTWQRYVVNNVLEEHAVLIFRVEVTGSL
jgi:hypothetical protein